MAVIFPGQGAQYVGMGVDLAAGSSEAREVWERVSAVIDLDLLRLAGEGPEAELTRTANAQPALLAASLAVVAALRRQWWEPLVGAGLSLGEYSALVASGALDLEDAARLVRLRGRLMEEAVPSGTGAMAAIMGLEREAVAAVCRDASGSEVVEPANFNCPGQVVVSGHAGAVARAVEAARAAGARRAVRLTVSGPFHSSLMRPAGDGLATALEEVPLRPGSFPVVANVSATVPGGAVAVREALVRQVSSPVLWEDSLRRMAAMGARVFLELGPGNSLAGLVGRTLGDAVVMSVDDSRSLAAALAELEGAC
ncbi:MAG: ACP S-malonyltransferase [bacterium]|nr:ACP S-malonyltransferase [bacterium]